MFFIKKVFLKILQNSQENGCVGVSASFFDNLQDLFMQLYRKWLSHRYFPANFA